ncbi:MAG: DUF1343 domain-containing protein [Gemmatimonadetes bacterium]|nr:DUF1343 domain-containing protein [Gemmatimonadota bacterium]
MTRRQSAWSALPLLFLAATACRAGVPQPEAPERGSETQAAATGAPAQQRVTPGIEVLLRDSMHLVRGKRVGFITNQTAVSSTGESAIDLLHRAPGVQLVALYGPEHGLRGGVEGGVKIDASRDEKTGVTIHSLYGSTQKPTAAMLQGVDVLLFDMQDIGARPYTFVWTMAMAMEAAAQQRIPFVVLDRPNPITHRAEAAPMEMAMRTVGQPITGYYPVPLRHGMTVGEVARYINAEFNIGTDLKVVPAAGWRSGVWFDQTGLPWINPSPNIRSLEAALNYSGLVLFEATNVTVGRGTDRPFSYIGAPWLNTAGLLERMRAYTVPGVRLDATSFTPQGEGWVPFRGENVQAVRFTITDRNAYQPVWTSLVLLSEIKRLHPTQFKIENAGFTQMLGSAWARQAFDRGDDPRTIWQRWETETAAWKRTQAKYDLYPD